MTKDHGTTIEDYGQYEALRKQGTSQEKAALIANKFRREAARRGVKQSLTKARVEISCTKRLNLLR